MSEVNWGLLQTTPAVDPLTALNNAEVARARQAATNIAQQKQDFDQQQALAAHQAFQTAAQKFQAGDYQGAQAALIGTGNADVINAGNSSRKEGFGEDQTGLEGLGGFLMKLKDIPEAQRPGVIAHYAPLLEAAGAHPEHIQEVMENPSDDMLNAAIGLTVSPEKQVQQGIDQQNANSTTLNSQTGVVNAETSRRTEQRLANTPVGISMEDNVYLPGQGAYDGTNGATGGAGTITPGAGTVAAKNNNPFNIKDDGKSNWQGKIGVDPNGFVMFDSPANGSRAGMINIANQSRLHGISTVQDLITKYAPAGDNNNTAAYIQTVSQALGVQPNQRINLQDPQVLAKIAPVIAKVESNGTPSGGAVPTSTAAGLGGVGGPTLIQQSVKKPSPNDVSANDPDVIQAARTYAATGQFPNLGNNSGATKRAALTLVNQWGVNAGEIAANQSRFKALQSAAALTEKQLSTIGAAEDTAKANAEIFLQTSKAVPYQSRFQTVNGLVQAGLRKVGNTQVTDMDVAAKAFLTEYAKVISASPNGAGQLSDSARSEAQETLRGDYSVDQKESALHTLYKDMENRVKYINVQKDRQSGEINNLSAKYDHLGDTGAKAPAAAPSAPPAGAQYLGVSKKTGRPVYQLPNGQKVYG